MHNQHFQWPVLPSCFHIAVPPEQYEDLHFDVVHTTCCTTYWKGALTHALTVDTSFSLHHGVVLKGCNVFGCTSFGATLGSGE